MFDLVEAVVKGFIRSYSTSHPAESGVRFRSSALDRSVLIVATCSHTQLTPHTLQNPVYDLDLIVVSTSLTFEGIMLSAKQPNITGGFLVFIRVWHFIRVGHGVHEIDDKVLQELAEDEEGGIRHPA